MDDIAYCYTPSLVFSCIIKNNSDDNVRVRINYQVLADGEVSHHDTLDADIPAGDMFQVERRSTDHGSYSTNQPIYSIEVIRTNGETQKLTAPFDGVHAIEVDWSFVIDNSEIRSVRRND